MAFFSQQREQKQTGRRRRPSQSVKVTEHVQVAIWTSTSRQGQKQYSWGIDRINPKDEASPFRTFWPEHLFELPEVIATLAKDFAHAPELGDDIRQDLVALAAAMEQVMPYGKANGRDAEANGESDSVLSL